MEAPLGFGCGSLLGRTSAATSRYLLESALDVGFTHFDVARSYGAGEAEALLGRVCGHLAEVTIATKVGLGRSTRQRWLELARASARPLIRRRGGAAVSSASPPHLSLSPSEARTDPAFVRASLATSLRALRRPSVDILFLHEVAPEQLTDELVTLLEQRRSAGDFLSLGLATSRSRLVELEAWIKLFDVVQCADSPLLPPLEPLSQLQIAHSVFGPGGAWLRHFVSWLRADDARCGTWHDSTGTSASDAREVGSALITLARTTRPERGLIITSSNPDTIRRNAGAFRAEATPSGAVQELLRSYRSSVASA